MQFPQLSLCAAVKKKQLNVPVFLIYAAPGMGGEDVRQPKYFAAAGEPKQLWKVPGAEHTGGIDARPAEYERRVIGFLDRALLEPK